MRKKKPTAGERMIAGAKSALAFAKGEPDHGCIVHYPEKGRVFLSFEDICLRNLPEGKFSHHCITAEEARRLWNRQGGTTACYACPTMIF